MERPCSARDPGSIPGGVARLALLRGGIGRCPERRRGRRLPETPPTPSTELRTLSRPFPTSSRAPTPLRHKIHFTPPAGSTPRALSHPPTPSSHHGRRAHRTRRTIRTTLLVLARASAPVRNSSVPVRSFSRRSRCPTTTRMPARLPCEKSQERIAGRPEGEDILRDITTSWKDPLLSVYSEARGPGGRALLCSFVGVPTLPPSPPTSGTTQPRGGGGERWQTEIAYLARQSAVG